MNMFVNFVVRSQLLIVMCSFLFFANAFSMEETPAQHLKSALKKNDAEKTTKSVRFKVTAEAKCDSNTNYARQPIEVVVEPKNSNNSCSACLQISTEKCLDFENLETLQGHSREFGAKGPCRSNRLHYCLKIYLNTQLKK